MSASAPAALLLRSCTAFDRGRPLGRRAGWQGVGVGGGETAGGGMDGGGGEGVAKPQRSSRASSARLRPRLSLGKEDSVASASLPDPAESLRNGEVFSLGRLLSLSVTDKSKS